MHPIDFFWINAGKVLHRHMTTTPAKSGDICAVCHRDQCRWLEPLEKVVFTQYGTTEDHCLSCHSLYEGSIELFGVERQAKGSPVPMKLGMATGCGALVTPEQTTLYLNGFIKKMSAAPHPPFPMVELSGKAAHLALINDRPTASEYLYIGNFGRKKKDLVDNLRLSNPKTLFICEESACTEINLSALDRLRDASKGVSQTTVNALRKALQSIYTGKAEPYDKRVVSSLEDAANASPALIQAVKTLPADPHQILTLLRMWQP